MYWTLKVILVGPALILRHYCFTNIICIFGPVVIDLQTKIIHLMSIDEAAEELDVAVLGQLAEVAVRHVAVLVVALHPATAARRVLRVHPFMTSTLNTTSSSHLSTILPKSGTVAVGPFLSNDVYKIFWFFDPLPPLSAFV